MIIHPTTFITKPGYIINAFTLFVNRAAQDADSALSASMIGDLSFNWIEKAKRKNERIGASKHA
jgi:hypothetical protein